jgi:kynurenine formamidase
MRKYIRLSYPITESMPLYPGTRPVLIEKTKTIQKGDSCNTLFISLSNHTGTHIDAPRHFFDSGRSIDDYDIEELIFRKPEIIDCPKGPAGVIGVEDLQGSTNKTDVDFLIIRTGFSAIRQKDVYAYCHQNPCLEPEAAQWLKSSIPRLRAVAIDCISFSSPLHREMGREIHKILLGNNEGRSKPICLIEDLNMPAAIHQLDEVQIFPLIITGADAAPCLILGIIND